MPVKTEPKPTPPPPDAENTGDTEPKTFDLSVTQLVGGALAAMTAAYLGSRLSVAGTVIGAAVASLVAGVGGTLYTASLRHTRDRVRSVWTGRTNDTPTEVVVTRESGVPDWGEAVTPAASAPAEPASPVAATASTAGSPPGTPLWRTGRFWKRIGVGAVASFALAAGAITGLELVSGQALSGGDGTTVSRVREPQTEKPSDKPSESPSESPSDKPSETPSAEASAAPSEAPSASSEPTQSNQTPAPADGNRSPSGGADAESQADSGAAGDANPAG